MTTNNPTTATASTDHGEARMAIQSLLNLADDVRRYNYTSRPMPADSLSCDVAVLAERVAATFDALFPNLDARQAMLAEIDAAEWERAEGRSVDHCLMRIIQALRFLSTQSSTPAMPEKSWVDIEGIDVPLEYADKVTQVVTERDSLRTDLAAQSARIAELEELLAKHDEAKDAEIDRLSAELNDAKEWAMTLDRAATYLWARHLDQLGLVIEPTTSADKAFVEEWRKLEGEVASGPQKEIKSLMSYCTVLEAEVERLKGSLMVGQPATPRPVSQVSTGNSA